MDIITDYGNGICAIDAGYLRPQMAAIHLIESEGRAALVDTANHEALPRVLDALAMRGLAPDCVDYVILTHVHLDHAGGASSMMNAFPNARLVVHPRGARHMADPSKLMAGVEAVYGKDRAAALYGELRPIATDRIIEARDGTKLTLAKRELLCLDTPGHAKHHLALVDLETSGVFTGDTFGISYRELDVDGKPFLFPSTTPSQFNPVEMRKSVERILAFDPEAVYLAHYGRIARPRELAVDLLRRLDESVRMAEASQGNASAIEKNMAGFLLAEAHRHGCTLPDDLILEVWALDLELNAQGVALWGKH